MERTEFMVMCGECLRDFECMEKFDRTKESLLDGTAVWNQALEVAYNDYVSTLEYEEEEDRLTRYYHDEAVQNMPCDNSGYCGGWSCPRFHECQGLHH